MTNDAPCPRRDKWFQEFQEREKLRSHIGRALVAADAEVLKAFRNPPASVTETRRAETQGGSVHEGTSR